jgi:hypothetical protein
LGAPAAGRGAAWSIAAANGILPAFSGAVNVKRELAGSFARFQAEN